MTIKFLVLGDLHGDMPKILTKNFDAIIATGDICGDDIKPYVRELMRKRNEVQGEYDFNLICPKWKQKLYKKISFFKGRRILRFLNKIEKPVFLVPGNWDPVPHDGMPKSRDDYKDKKMWNSFLEGKKNIFDLQGKKMNFKGIMFIGHGATSAPEILRKIPKNRLRDSNYKKIADFRTKYFMKIYDKFAKWVKISKKPVIILSHNSVYNTKLDLVKMKGSYADDEHYGSVIVRKLVDKFQPMLVIGGHIHEGYGREDLGNTICINAGYGGKVNTIITVDERRGEVLSVDFLGENKAND